MHAPCKPFTISDQNIPFPIPCPIEPDLKELHSISNQPFLFLTHTVVETSCYRVVLRLKFIVTVELLDQAESDFVQCQTKMRAFASMICSEFKQIGLRIVHQNTLWSLVFSTTQAVLDTVHVTNFVQSRHCRWWTDSFTFVRVVSSIFFAFRRLSSGLRLYFLEKFE